MNVSLWNVTSMVHKTEKIMEHIMDRDSDIVFLTETWLTSDFNHVTALVKNIIINYYTTEERTDLKRQVVVLGYL